MYQDGAVWAIISCTDFSIMLCSYVYSCHSFHKCNSSKKNNNKQAKNVS